MKHININLAKEKGLINNEDDSLYQKLAYNYKYLLEYYLNSVIDFSKYENKITTSDLYIGKTNKYHELNVFLKLDYLFLMNNLFVEKLDKTDIDIILSKFNKDNIEPELIDIIKRTFKEVIKDNYFKGEYTDKIYNVCYGPVVPFNFVDNNSLVFRFYYGRNLISLEGDKLLELDEKQISFINEQINLFKKEIIDKLDVNCEILIKKDID